MPEQAQNLNQLNNVFIRQDVIEFVDGQNYQFIPKKSVTGVELEYFSNFRLVVAGIFFILVGYFLNSAINPAFQYVSILCFVLGVGFIVGFFLTRKRTIKIHSNSLIITQSIQGLSADDAQKFYENLKLLING